MFHPVHPRYQTVKRRPETERDEALASIDEVVTLRGIYARIDEDLAEL